MGTNRQSPLVTHPYASPPQFKAKSPTSPVTQKSPLMTAGVRTLENPYIAVAPNFQNYPPSQPTPLTTKGEPQNFTYAVQAPLTKESQQTSPGGRSSRGGEVYRLHE